MMPHPEYKKGYEEALKDLQEMAIEDVVDRLMYIREEAEDRAYKDLYIDGYKNGFLDWLEDAISY